MRRRVLENAVACTGTAAAKAGRSQAHRAQTAYLKRACGGGAGGLPIPMASSPPPSLQRNKYFFLFPFHSRPPPSLFLPFPPLPPKPLSLRTRHYYCCCSRHHSHATSSPTVVCAYRIGSNHAGVEQRARTKPNTKHETKMTHNSSYTPDKKSDIINSAYT